MKLGISTYSLYQAMQNEGMTVLDALEWIAANGGEHAEIVPIDFDLAEQPELADRIRNKASACGIALSNYAIGADFLADEEEAYEAEINRVMRHVDAASRLGVTRMRHDAAARPPAEATIHRFEADLDKVADACRLVADYAARYGITTSVENHGYHVQDSDRVQRLVRKVDRDNFKTTLDIGNFMCVDEDPFAAVLNNISIASMIHVKDFYLRPAARNPGEGWFRTSHGNYLRGAIAGHGDLNLTELLRIVEASGYDGYISIEFEGMENCKAGTRIGLENIRRIWDGL
jgi:sugar phosphate isomerase/epimerase